MRRPGFLRSHALFVTDDKTIGAGRGCEFEIRRSDCFHGIGKAGVIFRAYKRVYRHRADLHIQVFGRSDFQHGVKRVE